MRRIRDYRGITLIELMITLAIFSIILTAVYSVYISFLRHSTEERKIAKTELDVITTQWPLIKEIQTAGYGVPDSGSCTPAIIYPNEEGGLTIHSTAAGDAINAGKWSYVRDLCAIDKVCSNDITKSCSTDADCTTPGTCISSIPDDENVVVIDTTSKKRRGAGGISNSKVNPCDSDYYDKFSTIAFWIPSTTLECYEIRYALRTYDSNTRPLMCESNTMKLSRSVSTTAGTTDYQPLLDCVLSLNFRFGCIDSSGNITWQTDENCGSAKLRLIRIGLLLQSSPRRNLQVPSTITLFEDLPPASQATINLTTDQRYYKWKKVEQTIPLRNLE